MRSKRPHPLEIAADPFHERSTQVSRTRMQLLGGAFEFECGSVQLRQLVDWAYGGLPRHVLREPAPRIRIRLLHAPPDRPRRRDEPRRVGMLSGPELLCGATSEADFAVIAAEQRAALVVVSREMLRFPYNTRYELVEFAVFTLAMRTQGLIPLHGACVGHRGRGLLLMGESGAGKSTASLHALLQGMDFLSEDSMFVTSDARRATGVANFLHVRCDSLGTLPRKWAAAIREAPVIQRRSGVRKFEIDLRRPEFQLARRPLEVAGLVFMSKQQARPGGLLSPLRPREVIERMKQSQAYATTQPGWMTFRKRIGSLPAYELRRGRHPDEAVEAMQGLLA